jgi:hypothetical protein
MTTISPIPVERSAEKPTAAISASRSVGANKLTDASTRSKTITKAEKINPTTRDM